MRKLFAIAGFLVLGTAQAEVYKCTDAAGKTVYQPNECATGPAQQVNIKTFDEKKIAEAQAKLAESLKHDAEREAAAAEAAQKEREIAAREGLAAQVRQQTDAINRNAQAMENANQTPPPVNYYVPPATSAPPPTSNSAPKP